MSSTIFSVPRVAEILDRPVDEVNTLVESGDLGSFKVPGMRTSRGEPVHRVPREYLIQYLKRNQNDTGN